MRKAILTLVILFQIIYSCDTFGQTNYSREQLDSLIWANPITNVNAILDSFEVIKKIGAIVDGFNYPPTEEEIRLNRIAGYMFKLPFFEAEKLLHDKNTITKVHAFMVLVKKYPDKILKKHLEIFSDKSKLYAYTSRGNIDMQMSVGEYCKMAYESERSEEKK